MFEIIQRNDQRAPLAIMEDHINNNVNDPWTTCPWVKVGNLYMSVTQTSDSSWPTLVRHLQSQGQTKFTVFSGRHGTQAGQAVSESKGILSSKYVLDKAFYQNDVRAAAQFGNAVKVVDVGASPQTTTTVDFAGQHEASARQRCRHLCVVPLAVFDDGPQRRTLQRRV
ncbi:hypothetical protein [Polyangium jinanense]|uniref:Uncharacterized protein n=1 Tax=Polyangium jinanense TaxID=2829994 RepID=A0A9X4AR44_9BACT|nr:hypothetical protein [Polyangium jinanense]MDC3953164.1 hypothetical protein [Polyangium jinanense]MDC3979715.1 hypothetical protein [Polyangium jinanense]